MAIAMIAMTIIYALPPALAAETSEHLLPAASDEFYGMRLGETTTELRAWLGKPAMTWDSETGDFWSYHMDGDRSWRVGIIQHGRVVGIYVRQAQDRTSHLGDGAGIALNDSQRRMFALRGVTEPLAYETYMYATLNGVRRFYEITDGKVTGMGITRSYGYALPPLVTWDRRDGDMPYRAYRLARSDHLITRAENAILFAQSCNTEGRWHVVRSTQFSLNGRIYDRVLAACSVAVYRRNFYFDVTDVVAKRRAH